MGTMALSGQLSFTGPIVLSLFVVSEKAVLQIEEDSGSGLSSNCKAKYSKLENLREKEVSHPHL